MRTYSLGVFQCIAHRKLLSADHSGALGKTLTVRLQELEVELEMPTRHRHEGVGDVSLIVRDAKPRRAASPSAASCVLNLWDRVRRLRPV